MKGFFWKHAQSFLHQKSSTCLKYKNKCKHKVFPNKASFTNNKNLYLPTIKGWLKDSETWTLNIKFIIQLNLFPGFDLMNFFPSAGAKFNSIYFPGFTFSTESLGWKDTYPAILLLVSRELSFPNSLSAFKMRSHLFFPFPSSLNIIKNTVIFPHWIQGLSKGFKPEMNLRQSLTTQIK